jgi:hypothetical protein
MQSPGTVDGTPIAMWYPVTSMWFLGGDSGDDRLSERTRVAAAKGDPNAQFAMSVHEGWLAATKAGASAIASPEQLQWVRKAAEGNHAMAQMHLGAAYELGIGTAQDEKEARRWYELSAAQGNMLAIDRLRLGAFPRQVGPVPF